MMDNEYYFKKRAVLSKDWLHATIVKFSGVPKSEMMTILLEARRQTPCCTPWSEDMLRKADKFYQLRGVERLFMYTGNLLLSDPLPVKCHYRPLLRAAMVHRMVSVPFIASSRIDAVGDEIQFECYKFDGEQNDVCTRIHCNLNSQSVPILEDFSITDNWRMYDARLKGQRVDQSIFDLFVDLGMDMEFTRDAKTFMKDFIDACYDEYGESFHTCLNGMSEEERSLLDDGQMSIK